MIIYGTAHKVGDDIGADQIIDPALHDAGDPALLAAACLAAVDPALAERVGQGDILLAGARFGGGAPEQAVLALQALGFAAVICAGAAAAFVETAHAYGLPVLICPPAAAALEARAPLRIDLERGTVADRAGGASFSIAPAPPALLDLLRRAQLYASTRRLVEEDGLDG